MTRVSLIILTLVLIGLGGCSKPPVPPAPAQTTTVQTTPSASPSVSPSVMAVAPTLAMPTPQASGMPKATIPPGQAGQKAPPSFIEDRLKRALTLEEINRLPPEIRDTILRAQGRLPASPAPSPKKK